MHESSADLANKLKGMSGWEFDQVQGYSLGYLLRKLPRMFDYNQQAVFLELVPLVTSDDWHIAYVTTRGGNPKANKTHYTDLFEFRADFPENAACLLAIKLFEQGVLTAPSPDKEQM